MEFRRLLQEYFNFTRRERIGVLALLALTLLLFLLPGVITSKRRFETKVDTGWFALLEPAEKPKDQYRFEPGTNDDYFRDEPDLSSPPRELFIFNPNSATPEEWRRLGLREKTIRTIRNYLSRGGRFRRPEDLGKIYGLPRDDLERLLPYVRIPSQPVDSVNSLPRLPERPRNDRTLTSVDINTADSASFEALPGIGSRLAARIVKFREKLGGFYSIGQVGETYGLPDSSFQRIRPFLRISDPLVRKIPLNSATIEQLQAHPYIGWKLARPIVSFREQHGHFQSPEDLKKVLPVTEEIYLRLQPYLSLD